MLPFLRPLRACLRLYLRPRAAHKALRPGLICTGLSGLKNFSTASLVRASLRSRLRSIQAQGMDGFSGTFPRPSLVRLAISRPARRLPGIGWGPFPAGRLLNIISLIRRTNCSADARCRPPPTAGRSSRFRFPSGFLRLVLRLAAEEVAPGFQSRSRSCGGSRHKTGCSGSGHIGTVKLRFCRTDRRYCRSRL